MEDRTPVQPPVAIAIYIAAASSEIERAEKFIAAVRAMSEFEITHDWTPDVRSAMKRGIPEFDLHSDDRFRSASQDVEGVMSSEVFVLLVPRGSFGAGFEFATACSRPDVLVVCSGVGSIFTEYTDARYPDDTATLIALPHLARVIRSTSETWKDRMRSRRRARLFAR